MLTFCALLFRTVKKLVGTTKCQYGPKKFSRTDILTDELIWALKLV